MVGLEIMIVVLLLAILFIVLTGHVYIIKQPASTDLPIKNPDTPPVPKPIVKPNKKIGGCEGTRYGCCPYSEIPKLNEIGSNCRYQY
jgi:hypothetical protein